MTDHIRRDYPSDGASTQHKDSSNYMNHRHHEEDFSAKAETYFSRYHMQKDHAMSLDGSRGMGQHPASYAGPARELQVLVSVGKKPFKLNLILLYNGRRSREESNGDTTHIPVARIL
jgi:hypothetical protein